MIVLALHVRATKYCFCGTLGQPTWMGDTCETNDDCINAHDCGGYCIDFDGTCYDAKHPWACGEQLCSRRHEMGKQCSWCASSSRCSLQSSCPPSPPPPPKPVQQVTICRKIKTRVDPIPAPMRSFSACCEALLNATGPTCCNPVSPMWESVEACLHHEDDGRYLSVDAGIYGSFKLLATADASEKVGTVRAKLQQVIKFDPECLAKSALCPAQSLIYEELNSTLSTAGPALIRAV